VIDYVATALQALIEALRSAPQTPALSLSILRKASAIES